MTELFEIYQENIKILFGKITRILDNVNTFSNDKIDQSLNEADAHVKEAERLIKNMELGSMSSENDYSLILRNYKTGVDAYKKRIHKAKEGAANSKKLDSLILTTDSSTQKEKLINNDEVVWNSFEKLEKAKRSTIEMENVSIEIARDLHNQTDKMKNIGSKVGDMNRELAVSTGLIGRMMRLQRRNKLIIGLFSLFLIMTFLVILYVKISGESSNSNSNSNSNATNIPGIASI